MVAKDPDGSVVFSVRGACGPGMTLGGGDYLQLRVSHERISVRSTFSPARLPDRLAYSKDDRPHVVLVGRRNDRFAGLRISGPDGSAELRLSGGDRRAIAPLLEEHGWPVEHARRWRSMQIGAAGAVCLVLVAGLVAVRLGRATPGPSMGAPPSSTAPESSGRSYEWDCAAISLWDVLASLKQRAGAGDTVADGGTLVSVGRVGPEIRRTTTPDTRTNLAFENTLWSFDPWRSLYPRDASVGIDSVESVRAWRTDVAGTVPPCDDLGTPAAITEGAVVVSVLRVNSQVRGSWAIGSGENGLFFVVRPDGTAPLDPVDLDDATMTVQTADHRSACRQHPTCSLEAFEQEVDDAVSRG